MTNDNLSEFIGKPVYPSDKMYEETPAGVCMGLAWTAHGGSTLYIETVAQAQRDGDGAKGAIESVTGEGERGRVDRFGAKFTT